MNPAVPVIKTRVMLMFLLPFHSLPDLGPSNRWLGEGPEGRKKAAEKSRAIPADIFLVVQSVRPRKGKFRTATKANPSRDCGGVYPGVSLSS